MSDTKNKYNKRNKSVYKETRSKRRRIDYSTKSESESESESEGVSEMDSENVEQTDNSFIVGEDEISESDESDENGENSSDLDYDDQEMQIKSIQINLVMDEPDDRERDGNIRHNHKLKLDKNVRRFVSDKKVPENIKDMLIEKYKQFTVMNSNMTEYFKLKRWIDDLIKIPFGNYVKFPSCGDMHTDSNFLRSAQNTLNQKLYGQSHAKEELIEIMTKWLINPDSRGQVIGFHGSPGVGKTELAKNCIAPVMKRPFQYISLGGLTDGSYLDGHSYTYEGATYGRIVQMLMDAGCMNPIIFMDELDKISESKDGQEIVGKLIHLTDPTQNDMIMDKYFTGIPFDLSNALIIFSFNDENLIDKVLLNRIRVIKMDDFNTDDKIEIANKYLLPKLCKENRITVKISNAVLKHIIHKNREPGVRGLKSDLENIIMKLNVIRLLPEKQPTINVQNNMIFNMDMYHKIYQNNISDLSDISHKMMYI